MQPHIRYANSSGRVAGATSRLNHREIKCNYLVITDRARGERKRRAVFQSRNLTSVRALLPPARHSCLAHTRTLPRSITRYTTFAALRLCRLRICRVTIKRRTSPRLPCQTTFRNMPLSFRRNKGHHHPPPPPGHRRYNLPREVVPYNKKISMGLQCRAYCTRKIWDRLQL